MTAPSAVGSGTFAVPFVGVMAKAPRAGHAKTRLAQVLPPAVAADLHRHFLLDTIEALHRVDGVALGIICPPGDGPELRRLPIDVPVVEQPTAGLMAGLAFGIEHFLGAGHPAVVLVNADSPTLPSERIGEALQTLARHDVVLGPSADGGYYLVGATVSCTRLLCDKPYSDATTICAETLARARRLALRAASISPWFDVDLPSELEQLARALQGAPAHIGANTRRALEHHREALNGLASARAETEDPGTGR